MIEIIIAIAGSVIAGLWDLKTTEVPDEIPYLVVFGGIVYWFLHSVNTGDFYPMFISFAVGTIVLAVGIAMYRKGKWGGADAWLLASVAYLIPLHNGQLFIIPYIVNLFIVAVAYMAVYTVIIGIRKRGTYSLFKKEFYKNWKAVFAVPFVFFLFILFEYFYFMQAGFFSEILLMKLAWMLVFIIFLMFFWVYAKVIESHVFRTRIPAKKLKAGDVLENMIWRGITEDEVVKLRKTHKYVVIKEGVRFVPVFAITLVVTLLYGMLISGF